MEEIFLFDYSFYNCFYERYGVKKNNQFYIQNEYLNMKHNDFYIIFYIQIQEQ